ncbi:MAG: twin-arginine translocation signal domain-containing protein [Verrucomicrobia bacterium]|nr:MAG: twin-arginine translocation signal domain-containing protein [Verrucomicrobiota bacterium]
MKITRRKFLQNTAVLAAAGCGGCLSPGSAGRLSPVKILDAHTHFYDPSRPQGVPWPPKNDALLYRTVLPKDYRALPMPQVVTGTVVVEASPWVEDNQWVLDLAAREPFIVGFIGNLPLGTPEFTGHLQRFAAHPLFRGIRIREGALENLLNSRAFVADLHALAERGLCFEVGSQSSWVAQTDRLARTVPNLRLIVNHAASVSVTGKAPPEAWRHLMQKLAQHPQIFMKISGLVEGTRHSHGDAPANAEFYEPALDALWNTFGTDRLIYGSNWPVSERFAPLATVQQIAMAFFATKGQAALDKVFWQNAQVAYKCKVPRGA